MDGDTPIDCFEPQFTQREASDISGADMKTINNWIDRKHLVLTEVSDRRVAGRRLFSIADIAAVHTMHYCTKMLDCPPAAAVEISAVVRDFMVEFGRERPKTPDGKHYKIWHICKRSVVGVPGTQSFNGWHFQGIWQHPDSGAFYYHNPGIFGDEPFAGFPHFPCIMLPTSQLAARIFLKCSDLLLEDAGNKAGAASEGFDE